MLHRLLTNSLLVANAVCLALYWTLGYQVKDPYLSVGISVGLLLTGGLNVFGYAEGAFRVVVLGERDGEGHGGDWAAYGMFLLAFGSVYAGVFNLLWVINHSPMSWIGTPQSNFGRFLMGAGFAFIFYSPDHISDARPRISTLALAVVGTIAVTVAFFAGLYIKDPIPGLTIPLTRGS